MRAASKRFSCALISTHCQCIILFKIEADYIHDKHYQQEYYHDILSQEITVSPNREDIPITPRISSENSLA
jgi:hypothetical protein